VGEVLSLEEQGESAREFIEGLIEELGLEAAVSLRVVDSETVEVVVEGQELGILVGGWSHPGALQELARTVVQSRTTGLPNGSSWTCRVRAKRSEACSASPAGGGRGSLQWLRTGWSRCWFRTGRSSTTGDRHRGVETRSEAKNPGGS